MWNQIKSLSFIELCNVFGLNEVRYSKGNKKKRRLLGLFFIFLFLSVMTIAYSSLITYAYIFMGFSEIIPLYLSAVISIVILIFTISKAGAVIFKLKTYENVIVLPVKPSAIVISRFATMYVFNVLLTFLILLPSTAVYGFLLKPGFSFYFMMILGGLTLPLLPMTIATFLGALIYSVSSRMKHKNLVAILLFLFLVLFMILIPVFLSFQNPDITEGEFTNLSALMFSQIGKMYPPALLFSSSVLSGNFGSYFLFSALSVAFFGIFTLLVGRKFKAICTALQSSVVSQNYTLLPQRKNSPLKALYFKEIKRYFASSIYVMNTSIGYLLMVIFSALVLFFGSGKIKEMFPIENLMTFIFPFLLSMMASVSPTTTSAVSIEGKEWWIVKSLPIPSKAVFDSKILVNLTIALPCYIVSEILLLFALRPRFTDALFLVLLPLFYIFFTSVLGLTIDRKMPLFDWEAETVPVKQGKAVIVSMLLSFFSVAVPAFSMILLPAKFHNLVLLTTLLILGIITAILYRSNNKIELRQMN